MATNSRRAIERVARILGADSSFAGTLEGVVVYGGDERLAVDGTELLPWSQVPDFAW